MGAGLKIATSRSRVAMRKTSAADTDTFFTRQRASFLRHHKQPQRCDALDFEKQCDELRRLKGIISSVDKPRPMDKYDRMLHLSRMKTSSVAADMARSLSGNPMQLPDELATEIMAAQMERVVSFSEGPDTVACSRRMAVVLPPKRTLPDKLSSKEWQGGEQAAVPELKRTRSDALAKLQVHKLQQVSQVANVSKNVAQSAAAARKLSVRQNTLPRRTCDAYGNSNAQRHARQNSCTTVSDSQELFASVTLVIEMIKGKSRLKQDMLMKEFVLMKSGDPSSNPDGDGLSPSAFKGFLATKGVMDPFLVERLFRAIDENQNGEITFAEFKRAVQLLKGTLEQRLGCQSPARRLLLNTRLLQGFTSEYLTLATTGV